MKLLLRKISYLTLVRDIKVNYFALQDVVNSAFSAQYAAPSRDHSHCAIHSCPGSGQENAI